MFFCAVVAKFIPRVTLHGLNQNSSKLSYHAITQITHHMEKYSIKKLARDLLLKGRPRSDLAADKGTV